jgi:acetylornithine/N-succinyldiaminopimelate aminotransferase
MPATWNPHLACPGDLPMGLEIDRAEGLYLYDVHGKRYMDLISGLAVANIGHGHPNVIKAIKDQVDKHLHVMVYGEYVQSAQNRFANLLTSVLPDLLNSVYFVNSGTEANEAALKLAKRATGRTKIVACNGSYHGSTHGSLSVTGNESKKKAFRPLLPDVYFIDFNDEAQFSIIDENTAAVIIEPIQGDAGIRIPSDFYLMNLRAHCSSTGTLIIMDEVQTGFGRCGSLFAFEQLGCVPDILTLGKALGGGMPMGAFVSSKATMSLLQSEPSLGHITTFGGHPVCCAAGHASLQVIIEERLVEAVMSKGALFKIYLKHSAIRDFRQIGLFMAIELADAETVTKVVERCLVHGVIGFYFLSCRNSFRLAPPLNITEKEIETACALILQSINEVCGKD